MPSDRTDRVNPRPPDWEGGTHLLKGPMPLTPSPLSRSLLADRARGCLLGLATGNVLGLAVESLPREAVHLRLGSEGPFTRLPTEERLRTWDDDLAMAMALSGCLADLPPGTDRLEGRAILEAYLAWLRTGARGIGSLTREVLMKWHTGEARAAERVWQAHSDRSRRPLGNGAAMRIAPLGVAFAAEPEKIARLAAEDAQLTHWDPACRQAAGLIALLATAGVRGAADPLAFATAQAGTLLPEVAEAFQPLPLAELARRRIDGWDMGSILLALQAATSLLASGLPYAEAMPWLIRQGGDTDTHGAIVGALLGARDGVTAIPAAWQDCVADRERILDMADRLLRRSGL